MTKKTPKLLSYEQIIPALPHPISRRQMIRMSGKRFPPFVRPAGFKSPPLWLESAVLAWIKERYSAVWPDYSELEGLSNSAKSFHGSL